MLRMFFRPALQQGTLRMSALLAAAFALLMAGSVHAQSPIPPLISPVVDITGTLGAADIAQLERQALALQQRKGSQLQILIVPSTRPETIEAYAQRAFDAWKLGRQGIDDGVLLLVAKDDRTVRIHPGYGLEGAIPDITASRVIQEYLVPRFRAGDFAGGIGDATAQLVRLIEGESLPPPMAFAHGRVDKMLPAPIGVFAGFWFALMVSFFASGLPRPMRALVLATVAGSIAGLVTHSLLAASVAAAIGFVLGLVALRFGRLLHSHASSDGALWSGGSSVGGSRPATSSSRSSSSSSNWSGGGGRSGGGGASGSW